MARLVAAAVLLFFVLAAAWLGLPLVQWLHSLHDTILDAGLPGVGLFIALYMVSVAAFAPATVFTVAAGALWGWWGVPVALAGAWLGSMLAFGISKQLLGHHCHRFCKQNSTAEKLNRVVESLGWRGVLLSRLSPLVPFSLQNYLFGMTRVTTSQFAIAGMIGMLPATLVKVWIGATIGFGVSPGGLSTDDTNWPVVALLGAGVIATVVAATLFVRHWGSLEAVRK